MPEPLGEPGAQKPPPVRLRRDLAEPIPAPRLPDGFSFRAFQPSDAEAHHALLVATFDDGDDGPFDAWWAKLSSDPEYDPALIFHARDADGRLAGVAQCFTSNFLRDLAVHPDMQGRGIGAALLAQVFCAFRERGAPYVDLKTDGDNFGALRFYARAGMRQVPFEG